MKTVILGLLLLAMLLGGCAQDNASAPGMVDSSLRAANATKGADAIGADNTTGAGGRDARENLTGGSVDSSTQPTVYFFYLSTCGFCQKQKKEINPQLKAEFPQVKWVEVEVTSAAGRLRWQQMMGERNQTPKTVPVTIIGPDVISGYYAGETETKIRAAIKAEIMRVGQNKSE